MSKFIKKKVYPKIALRQPLKSMGAVDSDFSLSGDQVILKPFGSKELFSNNYLKWMNDSEITRTIGRFDYLLPVNRQKLIDYYKHIDTSNTVFFAIYYCAQTKHSRRASSRFVGTFKIYDMDRLAQRASIGILIGDRNCWGKGIATSAIKIASQYIFEVLGFRKITAGYYANNVGMERAFLKNGYKKEAVLRKHLFCAGKFIDHVFVCKFRSGHA